MDNANRLAMEYILRLASRDPEYQRLHREYVTLEDAFDDLTDAMTEDEKDTAWGYVLLGEQMSRHLLALACRYISLPPDTEAEDSCDCGSLP